MERKPGSRSFHQSSDMISRIFINYLYGWFMSDFIFAIVLTVGVAMLAAGLLGYWDARRNEERAMELFAKQSTTEGLTEDEELEFEALIRG